MAHRHIQRIYITKKNEEKLTKPLATWLSAKRICWNSIKHTAHTTLKHHISLFELLNIWLELLCWLEMRREFNTQRATHHHQLQQQHTRNQRCLMLCILFLWSFSLKYFKWNLFSIRCLLDLLCARCTRARDRSFEVMYWNKIYGPGTWCQKLHDESRKTDCAKANFKDEIVQIG